MSYYEIISWTGSTLTLIIQLYILYLIQFKCSKHIDDYAYFLTLLLVYEILLNFVFGILLLPGPFAPVIGFKTRGLAKYLGLKFCMISTGIFAYAISMIILIQLYCLVYRYLIFNTNKNSYKLFMTTRFKIAVQFILQPISIGLGFYLYSILWTEWYIPIYIKFKNGVTTSPIRKSVDFPVIIDSGTTFSNTFYILMTVLFLLVEIMSFIFLYLILKSLRKNVTSLRKETYQLYWQFSVLLGAQISTPFIFISLPIGMTIIAAHLDWLGISDFEVEIGFLCLLFYGSTNSMLTILFVTPFRRHAADTFVFWWLMPILKCLKLYNPDAVQELSAGRTRDE